MAKLIAHFEEAEDARLAAFELEQKGFDAGDVLVHVPDVAHVDHELTSEIAGRSIVGLAAGAVVGAGLMSSVVLLVVRDVEPFAALLSIIGGAWFGGYAGFFWGTAFRLPESEEVFDAIAPDVDEIDIEVIVDDEQEARIARAVLEDHHGALV